VAGELPGWCRVPNSRRRTNTDTGLHRRKTAGTHGGRYSRQCPNMPDWAWLKLSHKRSSLRHNGAGGRQIIPWLRCVARRPPAMPFYRGLMTATRRRLDRRRMPRRKPLRLSNVFSSRYPGVCADCCEHIPEYTLVRFDFGVLVHENCRRPTIDLDAWAEGL
jgi:hypothetical protein